MSRWIETEKGFVNLDHVIEAECMERKQHGQTEYFMRLRTPNERAVTTRTWGIQPDYLAMFATLIEAQPGQEAVLVRWEAEGRPAEAETFRMPILGWRIYADSHTDPTPILPEAPWSDASAILIVLPDGRLYGDGCYHDTVEKACAHLLHYAQLLWDREHAKSAAAD